jgi:DNA-directed RNA polymerase specialized sigma24 family protein
MQTSEDITMLSALKKDNKLEAYQYFFMKYYSPLCLKACQMLGNQDRAKEIVQQLFIEVWKHRTYRQIMSSAGGFFYQLLYERCSQLRQTITENDKAACPPCQTGPALVPQALPQLAVLLDT